MKMGHRIRWGGKKNGVGKRWASGWGYMRVRVGRDGSGPLALSQRVTGVLRMKV